MLMLVVVLTSAQAIINPHFTPLDLVKGSAQIQLLRIYGLDNKVLAAELVQNLKGQSANNKLEFKLGDEVEEAEVKAALTGKKSATAILFLSESGGKSKDDEPDGALEIDTTWFAIARQEGKLVLEKDQRQLFSVWAGSARLLGAASLYALKDSTAKFPVRSETSWGETLKLGKLSGMAHGCLVADFGKPVGICVVVLSSGADRVYRTENGRPTDVTDKLKVTTASKLAVLGDFNGDGRTGLVSWDGKSLKMAAQGSNGTFTAPKECGPLAECQSLACVRGEGARAGLVAGTTQGPVLLNFGDNGALQQQPLAIDKSKLAQLGPGGLCIVADFNGDGNADVMALYSKGALLFTGETSGKFKAPELIALPLVDHPGAALCGDYDADGLLDVLVAGKDGLVLLSRESAGGWNNVTHLTGELAYHGNANRPEIVGCAPCDVNTDGRQGMAMFYRDRKPLLFFNRGFSCFGWARELDFDPGTTGPEAGTEPNAQAALGLRGAEDLKRGQMGGAILDLNGDGVADMLAVGAPLHEVWAVFGRREEGQAARTCVLTLPPSAVEPLTITVRDEGRIAGMYVVRPGIPAFVGRAEAGPMTLSWTTQNGKPATRQVEVLDEGSRFELKP